MTTNAKGHTPGPWRYERDPDGTGIVPHARVWGASVHIDSSGSLDSTEADMRLIAAAPDLLAALREIALDADGMDWAQIREIANAAVAKVQP